MPCRDEGAEGSTSVAGDLVGRGVIHTVQATGDEVEPEFGAGNETLHEYRRVPREQSAGPGPHRRRRAEPDQNTIGVSAHESLQYHGESQSARTLHGTIRGIDQ